MKAAFGLTFSTLLLALQLACGSDEPAPDAGVPDSGTPTFTCVTPTMGPTMHQGFITAKETWTAAGSPHILEGDVTVSAGGLVAIQPCAEVRIQAGHSIYVDGRLTALSSRGRFIRIVNDEPGARFGAIHVRHPGKASFAEVIIEGGGDPAHSAEGATVVVEGGTGLPIAYPVDMRSVTIRNSGGVGMQLRQWTGFILPSRDLTIAGSGADVPDRPFPMIISLNAVNTIPAGTYTGNRADEIQVIAESPHYKVETTEQFKARGVPYRIGGNGAFGNITVDGPSLATLTLDPGVKINFSSSSSSVGGLHIGGTRDAQVPTGALIAVGTAEKPIVLSAQPDMRTAGGWEGVVIESIAPTTKMEYVRIEFAGAHGGDNGFGCPPEVEFNADGALKIFQVPSTRFLSNSTIADARGHGVYRGWSGDKVDFLPINTFERIQCCL